MRFVNSLQECKSYTYKWNEYVKGVDGTFCIPSLITPSLSDSDYN